MFERFYVKYILFVGILFLTVLIINANNNRLRLDLRVADIETANTKQQIENDLQVYVLNEDDMIFPLTVNVKRDLSYRLNGYEGKIFSEQDTRVYYTFSLLTNTSNYLPFGVKTIIPKSTKLISYSLDDEYLTLNVSKDFYNYNEQDEKKVLSVMTHTFSDLLDVDYIKITVEDKDMKYNQNYPTWLEKEKFMLNPYLSNNLSDEFENYLVYYYIDVEDQLFLVPVCIIDEYTENKKEKIDHYLNNSVNLPVMSLMDESTNESYVQYYLTMQLNGLTQEGQKIEIRDINYYEVEFY